MKIGLFGGTFDPPHDAHRAACLIAMRRLGLDRVWWLVTPGNPLKDTRGLSPLEERIAAAQALADHPRIVVTGLEAAIGARYTFDTVAYLQRALPRRAISSGSWAPTTCAASTAGRTGAGSPRMVPIAVVDRLGPSLYAAGGIAGQALARYRIPETARARSLAGRKPPAWVYLHGLKSPLSSTALRAARRLSQNRR